MSRYHLFEIADQAWCPDLISRVMTEFLAVVAAKTRLFEPTGDLIAPLLSAHSPTVIALAAGSGGGIMQARQRLPAETQFILTDLRPDLSFTPPDAAVSYERVPVNVLNLPQHKHGVWVMYGAFHHLKPEQAKDFLCQVVASGQAIAIFEGTQRSALGLFACLFIPLMALCFIPFIRPLRWQVLLLTYVIPILPFLIFWDGLVSALRTYAPDELQNMTEDLKAYHWDYGVTPGFRKEPLTYLIGKPQKVT